jgi:hypothetical protein
MILARIERHERLTRLKLLLYGLLSAEGVAFSQC